MAKLGFLGCGQMAQALAKGFCNAKLFRPEEVLLSDTNPQMLACMAKLGYKTTTDNTQAIKEANTVVLAVKPQIALSILQSDVKPHWSSQKLLISICAGLTLDMLEKAVGMKSRLARVMPNTCCSVGASATCFAVSDTAKSDIENIIAMFKSVGLCYAVDEHLLDAVTSIAGSGPAYVFMMIEAMADAGVKGGLPRDIAINLAAQTVLGSAKMVIDTEKHPAILKDQVSSPAGTTIAATAELEHRGFRSAIISAIEKCRERTTELGKI